jgi:hypothetical protein
MHAGRLSVAVRRKVHQKSLLFRRSRIHKVLIEFIRIEAVCGAQSFSVFRLPNTQPPLQIAITRPKETAPARGTSVRLR